LAVVVGVARAVAKAVARAVSRVVVVAVLWRHWGVRVTVKVERLVGCGCGGGERGGERCVGSGRGRGR
jgi:hypothetical protein